MVFNENIRQAKATVHDSLREDQYKVVLSGAHTTWHCAVDTNTFEFTVEGMSIDVGNFGELEHLDAVEIQDMWDDLDGAALSELPAIGEYPGGLCWEEDLLRYCDVCGRNMSEGFVINGGEEYYCDEECLHTEYSKGEYLAMYAGLDNTDEAEVARALAMSQDELDALSEKNDSQTYWSTFED